MRECDPSEKLNKHHEPIIYLASCLLAFTGAQRREETPAENSSPIELRRQRLEFGEAQEAGICEVEICMERSRQKRNSEICTGSFCVCGWAPLWTCTRGDGLDQDKHKTLKVSES